MIFLQRIVNGISNILLAVAGCCILLMMLHVSADIMAKAVFNRPIVATLELVTWYYMVATVFLPVAYVQVRKKHLMVELFTQRLSPRGLALLEAAVALVALLYVATLTGLTLRQALASTALHEAQDATFFDLPVWPSRWFLPVAFGAMAAALALQGINDVIYGLTGRGKPTFTRESLTGVDEV